MSDWSHGYNVSQGYTYGSFRELSPEWLDAAAALAGYVTPARRSDGESFRYVEFGSGQGVGLCIAAANYPQAQFVGIDFNPEHIAHSEELARAAGLDNVRFIEGDFTTMGERWPADLGPFDYAVMHGIASWIPAPVRMGLMRCLEASLAPGALAYTSYNSFPGWAATLPFQHMVRRLEQTGALAGPKAITAGVELFETLAANEAGVTKALPPLKARIEAVKKQNPAYLVQEYLHDVWTIFWFSQIVEEMALAKLRFVGSATIGDTLLPGVLPEKLREQVLRYEDPIFRQEMIDCAINQSFRRDIFCRGPRRVFGKGVDALPRIEVHLVTRPAEEELRIATSYGNMSMSPERYSPVFELLSDGAMALPDLLNHPKLASEPIVNRLNTIKLLIHNGQLGFGKRVKGKAGGKAVALNRAMARSAAQGAPYLQLAAPGIRSIVNVREIDMVLLDAWFDAQQSGAEMLGSRFADTIAQTGRQLNHEGKLLEGDALRARGVELAREFLEQRLPGWKRLGAVA